MSRKSKRNKRRKARRNREQSVAWQNTPNHTPYVHWTRVNELKAKTRFGSRVAFQPLKDHAEAERTIFGRKK